MDEHDLVAAYALDALSPEERAQFEQHLAACQSCPEELAQLREVVGILPLAVDPIEPPAALKSRLIDDVTGTEGARRLHAIPGGRPAPRPRPHLPLTEILIGAVAAAAILALALWNISLQQSVNSTRSALAFQRQVATALAHGATVSPLAGVSTSGAAAAALIQPRGRRNAYLIVDGFPSISAQRVYELWLIPPHRAPVPAGVFRYAGTAPQTISINRPAQGYQLAAVTIEPGPRGTHVPTGPKVVVGRITL
ncbi:MAG TPA: anti-sigma factor [Chloroflexota bacterium]|nr:anti-sigma factor [Chloroflexota bacterium]